MQKTFKRDQVPFLPGPLQGLPWPLAGRPAAILPADVGRHLVEVMLDPANMLEDARYLKVVPNDYLVEISPTNYGQHYQPVEKDICTQWQERLLDEVNTSNSRQGRKEYRFGGRVRVRIQPAADLAEDEARITWQVNPVASPAVAGPAPACLEMLNGGQRWPLRAELTVLGREEPCDICLDLPAIRQKRLVSGQHAYIRREGNRFRLYDGSPDGRASLNGTFVNGQRVPPTGQDLRPGDLVILAALDPRQPRPDTPGVAALLFQVTCGD